MRQCVYLVKKCAYCVFLTLMDVRWLGPVTYNHTSHILIVFLNANDDTNKNVVKTFCSSSSTKRSYRVLMSDILLCILNYQYNENTVQYNYIIIKTSKDRFWKNATF